MTRDGTVNANWDPSRGKTNYGWLSSKTELEKKAFGKKKKSRGTCCVLWVVEAMSGTADVLDSTSLFKPQWSTVGLHEL